MDQAHAYVVRRLSGGEPAERIADDLISAGWTPHAAWTLIVSVGGRTPMPPTAPPAGLVSQPASATPPLLQAPIVEPQRPTIPTGSAARSLLLTSVVLGAAFALVTLVTFVSLFTATDGPRDFLAQFGDGRLPIALYLLVTVPLWAASLTTLLLARVRWRRELGGIRPRSALAAWAWFFVIGNPIIAAFTVALAFLLWVVVGIMCGEAVSESCGTGL